MEDDQTLVVEFHYADGDVGAYPAKSFKDAGDTCQALWDCFGPDHAAAYLVIRPDTPEGQAASNVSRAAQKALAACRLLKQAYAVDLAAGGSIDWSDVDDAYHAALEALKLAAST